MAGCLICGMPRSGKGVYLKRIAIPYMRRLGRKVCVLDPLTAKLTRLQAQSLWGADWVTADPSAFVASCEASDYCTYIVDEMRLWCSDYAVMKQLEFLSVAAGNRGNLGIFVGQRLMHMPPNFREMADSAVIFGLSPEGLPQLATLFRQPAILDASGFPAGVGMIVEPFKSPTYFDLRKDFPDFFPSAPIAKPPVKTERNDTTSKKTLPTPRG